MSKGYIYSDNFYHELSFNKKGLLIELVSYIFLIDKEDTIVDKVKKYMKNAVIINICDESETGIISFIKVKIGYRINTLSDKIVSKNLTDLVYFSDENVYNIKCDNLTYKSYTGVDSNNIKIPFNKDTEDCIKDILYIIKDIYEHVYLANLNKGKYFASLDN